MIATFTSGRAASSSGRYAFSKADPSIIAWFNTNQSCVAPAKCCGARAAEASRRVLVIDLLTSVCEACARNDAGDPSHVSAARPERRYVESYPRHD